MKDSLCWSCKKACGKCCWSRELRPVENWVATKTKISYLVKKCPLYEEANRDGYVRVTAGTIADMANWSVHTLYRYHDKRLIEKIKKLGYDLKIVKDGECRKFYLKKEDNKE